MRWRYPLILLALAAGLFVVGVAYGVVMVGVPTQDPTPAVAAAEARDARIAGWAMGVAVCLFLGSLAWFAVIGITTLVRRRAVA